MLSVVHGVAEGIIDITHNPVTGTVSDGGSPVWTGRFIDSWRAAVGSPDTSQQPKSAYYSFNAERLEEPFPINRRPSSFLGRNKGVSLSMKLGDTLYISNSVTYEPDGTGSINRFNAGDINRLGTRTAPQGVTKPSANRLRAELNVIVAKAIPRTLKTGGF